MEAKRDSTKRQLDVIANKAIERIRTISRELIAQYCEEINPEYFMQQIDRHDIERKYIDLFFKPTDRDVEWDPKYKYDHISTAEFLGYKAGLDNKYKRLRDMIRRNLSEGEDYIETELFSRDIVVPAKEHKNKSGNRRGLHSKTSSKVFRMTRTGFFILCMMASTVRARECRKAFAKVYELALDFSMSMKAKLAGGVVNFEKKLQMVEERLKTEVEKNKKRSQAMKMKKENKRLETQLNEVKEECASYKNKYESKCLAFQSLNRQKVDVELEWEKKVEELKEKIAEKDAELDEAFEVWINADDGNAFDELQKKMEAKENEVKRLKIRCNKLIKLVRKYKDQVEKKDIPVSEPVGKPVGKTVIKNVLKPSRNPLKKSVREKLKANRAKTGGYMPYYNAARKDEAKKTTSNYTKESLEKLRVVDLKDICRQKNIYNYSKKNKSQLIEHMLASERLNTA